MTRDDPRRVTLRPWTRAFSLAVVMAATTSCSPIYVVRAGIAEARILRGRRPLVEVIVDPETDATTRGKLVLVLEAREWARDSLGLDVGDAYNSFTQLESDTLALVLTAAHRDRLEFRTWWFPIVGRVPYRGFFDESDAVSEERKLKDEGFDTYLRPTAAFSTLGWFNDPLLSSMVRRDEVDLVETVLHELAHRHLFVSGQVRFNESFAMFVGRAGAVDFFCRRPGGGSDTVKCERARARWRDVQRFSRFLDGFMEELEALYDDPALEPAEKVARREPIAARHRARFLGEVQPELEEYRTWSFVQAPLNNATLLSQMLYYHRLPDFQALLTSHDGSLAEALAALEAGTMVAEDAFDLLPLEAGPVPP